MKKIIFALILVSLISAPGLFATASGARTNSGAVTSAYDFRRTHWGMSKNEVIAAEGSPQIESENVVIYTDIPFAGYSARLTYVFDNNQLFEAFYTIPVVAGDLNERFNKIKSIISVKYGVLPQVSDQDACLWNTPRSQVLLMIYPKYDEVLIAFRDGSATIPDDGAVVI